MRDYGKLSPFFWTRGSGKRLRGDPHAQVVAAYLATSPTANMIGIYYLSVATIANDTGIHPDEVRAALHRIESVGYAYYDHDAELVWIPNHARFEVGDTMSPGDKRRKKLLFDLAQVRDHHFSDVFLSIYGEAFELPHKPRHHVPRFPDGASTETNAPGMGHPVSDPEPESKTFDREPIQSNPIQSNPSETRARAREDDTTCLVIPETSGTVPAELPPAESQPPTTPARGPEEAGPARDNSQPEWVAPIIAAVARDTGESLDAAVVWRAYRGSRASTKRALDPDDFDGYLARWVARLREMRQERGSPTGPPPAKPEPRRPETVILRDPKPDNEPETPIPPVSRVRRVTPPSPEVLEMAGKLAAGAFG